MALSIAALAEAHTGRLHQHASHLRISAAPHKVGATVLGVESSSLGVTNTAGRYLVASFPNLKQVAYVHLPDNVWRPLVIGNVSAPGAVATDSANSRLFVADPPNKAVWWYRLARGPDGLLRVEGEAGAAAQNFVATWMAANGAGDLFFVGRRDGAVRDSIYRQSALKISAGSKMDPVEVYSQSNSGSPTPLVWVPSGLAVDAFHVYWGNQESGTEHGSVVQGPRREGGSVAQDTQLVSLSKAFDEVRGVTVSGTHVFWVAPDGVYGMRKGMSSASVGQLTATLAGGEGTWMPKSILFDGDNTLYLADQGSGTLYQLPAQSLETHNLTKFVDAPNIDSIALIEFFSQYGGSSSASCSTSGISRALLAAMAVLAAIVTF